MNQDIEEQLVALESIDTVRAWHTRMTGRELSYRRANEITSSARQAREYLRNAAASAHSVRPLLTYYGNAALSRAAVLLLRPTSAEESLARGHGLETVGWSNVLGANLAQSLVNISTLKIRTTAGLFRDLLLATDNRICIHARSVRVDWTLQYSQPLEPVEITLGEIASRLPDLAPPEHSTLARSLCARVNEVSFSQESGFFAKVQAEPLRLIQDAYISSGYEVSGAGELVDLRCPAAGFEQVLPQFTHAYVRKLFDLIPGLHICPPYAGAIRLSQIVVTFALSYILGMLTRYFPTHWIAMQSGNTGDALWPTLFSAQRYVELAYPELLLEFINHRLAQGRCE